MRINVAALKRVVGDSKLFKLAGKFPPLKLVDGETTFKDPINVSLKMTNAGNYLHAVGEVSCNIVLECGHCLEPYKHTIVTELEEKYYLVELGLPGEDDEEEEDYIPFSGDTIDITNEVKAAILLALPMRQICHEECKGLCHLCGGNLNEKPCNCKEDGIDPRMAVLKDFFKK